MCNAKKFNNIFYTCISFLLTISLIKPRTTWTIVNEPSKMQLKTEEMQYILLTFVCRPSGRLFFITIMITSMIIVIIIIVFLANFRAPHTKHTHNKHPTQA